MIQKSGKTATSITPTGLAKDMINAVYRDPGTERKCMVFFIRNLDRYARFVQVKSEARVMVLELDID